MRSIYVHCRLTPKLNKQRWLQRFQTDYFSRNKKMKKKFWKKKFLTAVTLLIVHRLAWAATFTFADSKSFLFATWFVDFGFCVDTAGPGAPFLPFGTRNIVTFLRLERFSVTLVRASFTDSTAHLEAAHAGCVANGPVGPLGPSWTTPTFELTDSNGNTCRTINRVGNGLSTFRFCENFDFDKIWNFDQKFLISTKILNFDQNFEFRLKFRKSTKKFFFSQFSIFVRMNFWPNQFLTKSIFDQNFNFWLKYKLLAKLSILGQIFHFWQKFKFFTKLPIFDENFDFWRNFRFLTKILIFDQNWRLISARNF